MVYEMRDQAVSFVAAEIVMKEMNREKSYIMSSERLYLTKEEALLNMLGAARTIAHSSCNKLFRKKLFEHLRFKKGIIYEDMEFLPRILDICNHIVLLNKPVYHYILREGSITESKFSLWRYQSKEIAHNTLLLYKRKYPSLVPYAYYYEMGSLYKLFEQLMDDCSRKEFYKEESVLRFHIVRVYIHCIRWSIIRQKFGTKIRNMVIIAFLALS